MDHGVKVARAEEIQNQNPRNEANMMQDGVEPPGVASDQSRMIKVIVLE